MTDRVQRIDYAGMSVDLVATSKGTLRIGSMPDIAKFLSEHGFREEIVVVPDWEVSLAGDNRTGEEFILWQAEMRGGICKEYLGLEGNVQRLFHHLNRIFPFYFDDKRLRIVRKRWLNQWFHMQPAGQDYSNDSLEVQCKGSEIIVVDENSTVYSSQDFKGTDSTDEEIESLLSSTKKDSRNRDELEITTVGCGNGFYGTVSNTIIRFGRAVIWIDPCGYPAHTLASRGIHWDDVTHFLFTHNHEDHTQGFTACLQRARKYRRTLKLIVTKSVFGVLQKLYTPLFPDLMDLVQVFPLTPGRTLTIDSIRIDSRWNHHILPYGTVGLKMTAGDKTFGYSGDTKYDEDLNRVLNREELTASWFADCDLVFHEIEFDSTNSVHSHWKQVEALQRKIKGQVLGYHTDYLQNSPLDLAVEGRRYVV